MRAITAVEAQQQFFQLIKENKRIEIQDSSKSMVMLPKEELDNLEKDILNKEMDAALSRPHKWYSSEELDAILDKVLEEKKNHG